MREVGTDHMVGRIEVRMVGVATVLADRVDITAATLWPLLLLLGLGGVGVLVVGTTDTTATTLVCPVTI
jgi:hypothetical protein